MKIESISVNDTILNATKMIDEEKGLSPALKSMFKVVLFLLKTTSDRLSLNSSNSSKPPSQDPNRSKKEKKKGKGNKKKKVGKRVIREARLKKLRIPTKLWKLILILGRYPQENTITLVMRIAK